MINGYFVGFLCIAGVAIGGVDYVTQAKAAGKAPGSYSVGSYLESIPARFAADREAKDLARRQAEPAKTHLPSAPEGWQRRAWLRDLEAEHQEMLAKMDPASRKLAEQVGNGLVGKMDRKAAAATARKESERQIWEYARGDEVIRLNARFEQPEPTKGIQGLAMTMVAANISLSTTIYQPYGVIKGVPFFEVISLQDIDRPTAEEGAPRDVQLIAEMGDAIMLKVSAHATDPSIRTLLEQIDYDSLNMMLDTPLAAVGAAAPEMSAEEEIAFALAALEARHARTLETAMNAEAQLLEAADAISGSTRAKADKTPAKANQAEAGAKGAGKAESKSISERLTGIFSKSKAAAEPAKDEPRRIKLSGGKSCLDGSAGKLCAN
jgi:hypothetical protein